MRENTAYLYGQLTRDPICYKNPSTQELLSGQITIKTARRTNATGELFVKGRLRIDFITIYSRNEKLIREQFMSLRQGDIVLVKGSLSTQETEKKFICKKCGHEMIKHEAVVIYIDPLHIKKFASGLSTEEGLKEIENNIEISNEIMITGTLCREPAYYKEKLRMDQKKEPISHGLKLLEIWQKKFLVFCIRVPLFLFVEGSKHVHLKEKLYVKIVEKNSKEKNMLQR